MGMRVETTVNYGIIPQLAASRRRAILAGGKVIREIADAGAPRDTDAMILSGVVELSMAGGMDGAAIIYRKFYSIFQERDEQYHHPVGHARFLELALTGGHVAAFERVAAVLREGEA